VPARSDDKFDEMRRAWIARHQGWSLIQRRRAELLDRKVRARQRTFAAAVPDPHDDTIIPPLWLRPAKSPASQVEMRVVALGAVLVPVGWLGGRVVNTAVTQMIPARLRAYPIAALIWSGAVLALCIALLYDPAQTLGQIVVAPWVCAQVAAIPFMAGIQGIAEGWLGVQGSDQWWPLTPPRRPLTAQDATLMLGPDDPSAGDDAAPPPAPPTTVDPITDDDTGDPRPR
jgi:hypothetical protein